MARPTVWISRWNGPLSGGSAVNDALLSGAVDIAGAGVGPLLTIWDRTRGKQNVKAWPRWVISPITW